MNPPLGQLPSRSGVPGRKIDLVGDHRHISMHVYVRVCVCVYVCVLVEEKREGNVTAYCM